MNAAIETLSRKGLRNRYRNLHMKRMPVQKLDGTVIGHQRIRRPAHPSFRQWLREGAQS